MALDLIYHDFPDVSSKMRNKKMAEKRRIVKQNDDYMAKLVQSAQPVSKVDAAPLPVSAVMVDSRGGGQSWAPAKGAASRQAKVKNYSFRQLQ